MVNQGYILMFRKLESDGAFIHDSRFTIDVSQQKQLMMDSVIDFLTPLNLSEISGDTGYKEGQIGKANKNLRGRIPGPR
jgi:hypothetical protein